VGDYGKAKRVLGWEPSVSFQELVRIMVDADMATLQQQVANGSSWR
jgi:GDPmannose 4,6-dehydratase